MFGAPKVFSLKRSISYYTGLAGRIIIIKRFPLTKTPIICGNQKSSFRADSLLEFIQKDVNVKFLTMFPTLNVEVGNIDEEALDS